jgi:beta-lactamase superfamily II metal-dependent hydrolase
MLIKHTLALAAAAVFAVGGTTPAFAQVKTQRNLEMVWIDTEGGAATLIITPSGESLLIDTGYPDNDRDATRINTAARAAGLSKIDHLVLSHYHRDHAGGIAALTKLIPIGRYYGPNDKVELVNREWYDSFTTASAGKRTIVKPGDRIPLKGVDVRVVSANEQMLARPINGGGANPLCDNPADMSPAGFENSRMVGVLLSFGKFTYLNLLDLDWRSELQLVCPLNKVGKVTLYQSSRHGGLDGAGSPALLGAIQPQVIVVNNGPKKGLGQVDKRIQPIVNLARPAAPYETNSYLRMAAIPGLEGIWQGHLSLLDKDPAHNTAEDMIANLEDTAECKGNVIKASVARDGKFTITNNRNGFSKNYMTRK